MHDKNVSSAPDDAVNPADIRFAAMNLLARREHSLRELREKLLRRFATGDLVEQALQRLVDENLQSDERYAQSYLRQRCSRGYGPLRIRQEMRERGVSDTLIKLALEVENPDWMALAAQAYYKKFGQGKILDLKEKSRRVRFLQYRGFTSEDFQHLLGD